MTKRSKLSLSAPQENVKKRPGGFRVPPLPTPRPAHTLYREQPAKPAAPTSTRTASAKVTQQQSPTWLNAGTITKTLLVVGAAALTIVLLKQRLF